MSPKRAPLSLGLVLLVMGGPAWAQDVVEYVVLDGLGNVRVVTDEKGNVLERHDYLAFGEECTTGKCATNPGVGAGEPAKFTGKERDQETGLDYFGTRYYRANAGRFTTLDPVLNTTTALVDPQRWNRYAYARNNPLRYVDPDGRELRTTQLQTLQQIAGPAAGGIQIVGGKLDVSGLQPGALSGNEGANLLVQLATSKNVYSYAEGTTIDAAAGTRALKGGQENLDNRADWRYSRGKGPGDLPPTGVDAAVALNPAIAFVDAATGTRAVSTAARAFHELAEAYAKIDKNLQYVPKGGGFGAHEDARLREQTLIGQRPGFTQFPAGELVKKAVP